MDIKQMFKTSKSRMKRYALAAACTVFAWLPLQAATTTTVIDLGAFESAESSSFNGGDLVKKIDLGALPPGSVLRSVTMHYRLADGDPYLGDLSVLFADNSGDNGILQIKGDYNMANYPKSAETTLPWNSGNVWDVGATATQTLTPVDGLPAIDLNSYAVWLQTGYPGTWQGAITLEYDIPVSTTTQTYNLGPQASPKTIESGVGGLLPWIAKGALPSGSILRSVSINAIIENVGSDESTDDWASDICVYIDPSPEAPGSAARLQVGGYGTIGTVSLALTAINANGWANGQGGPRTSVIGTKTAADWSTLGDIDLSTVQLSVGNDYSQAAWSGTITVEYEVSALTVALITPSNTQGYPTGTSITVTANVLEPNAALTDTVTFHTTPIAPAGPNVDTVSTDTTSPFSAVLGALPDGTYEIYATVTNNDSPPGNATSTTNTFTVAAGIPTTIALASSANTSSYGQSVTFTATVSPAPSGGTVQFYDAAAPLGSPVLVNTGTGVATYSSTALGAATHAVTAAYSGHWLHVASTSDALSHVVDKASLTVKPVEAFRPTETANPDPFTYTITGFQNGENLATSGVTGTPDLTTTAVLLSPPGDYTITCALGSLAASNYNFTLVNGALTVAEVEDIFSVNFYSYGGLTTEEQKANVLIAPGMPAGMSGWYASGWLNVEAPWGGGLQAPQTLTSTKGETATFTFKNCRNGGTYLDGPRNTLLGDGNGNMMDGHVNSTLLDDAPNHLFDMEVTDITFPVYDVIFYLGANQAQFGDGKGAIVFNGVERGFILKPGAFDGTFIEMVDENTEGNYIVFKDVTGSSFTAQTWGTGIIPGDGRPGFVHVGPFGFQIKDATPKGTVIRIY